jgi:hypothetical protein
MKRIQLFEIEDFQWFPKSIRNSMTNLIMVLLRMMGTADVLGRLISEARKKYSFNQVVDLGSGSGGAMPETINKLNQSNPEAPVNLMLTDLYPNPEIIKQFEDNDFIRYNKTSVDAESFRDVPEGLKTMINSFHHMPPQKAKNILKSASDAKQAILIYELAENKMPLIVWWLFLPISLCLLIVITLFMTPFVRPMSWQQIVFTYIIPVIPICYAWDGQASYPRTYSYDDLNAMLAEIEDSAYEWQVAPAKKDNGKNAGYYILGYPKPGSD